MILSGTGTPRCPGSVLGREARWRERSGRAAMKRAVPLTNLRRLAFQCEEPRRREAVNIPPRSSRPLVLMRGVVLPRSGQHQLPGHRLLRSL